MNEFDSKPWYASKGLVGSIVTILSSIIALVTNQTISDTLQACAVETVTELVPPILMMLTAFGGILSFWGRTSATKRISFTGFLYVLEKVLKNKSK